MTEYWDALSDDDKRVYIFAEIHYFHPAFVHREYKATRVPPKYWRIYWNWLKRLVDHSPMFLKVHEHEGNNFEEDFAKLVADMIAQRPRQAEPEGTKPETAPNQTAGGDA
jgi:hypothetical protein